MLSTLAIPPGNEGDPTERIETTRLSFAIIAEAMRDHPQNKDHFEVRRIHNHVQFPHHNEEFSRRVKSGMTSCNRPSRPSPPIRGLYAKLWVICLRSHCKTSQCAIYLLLSGLLLPQQQISTLQLGRKNTGLARYVHHKRCSLCSTSPPKFHVMTL